MGKIVIRITPHTYPRNKDIEQLIAYISGHGKHHKQKVYYRNAYGVSTSYQKAPHQMIQVQKYYKKDSKRRMCHMIISFPKDYRFNRICAIELAESIAQQFSNEYQIFFAIHNDTDNLHIHYAINSVSFQTGKKLHTSKSELKEIKQNILSLVNAIHKHYYPYIHRDLQL